MDPSQQQQNVPSIIEEKVVKPNGETHIRTYLKGKFLGKGGFARCYEFTNQETNQILAGKTVAKASLTKSRAKQKLMSEIKIHRSVKHQYIVQFQHFFEDSENVYILLELCANQSLNELLRRRKRLHELEVQCYTYQIIQALKYLHAHRVIHRDLKLGNLFINDKMEIKLGDFGLATKLDFDGEKKRTICGTPNYIAPEVLEGKCGHSYEVDVWSLGVIMYTLIIGKPPFETSDVKTTYKRIRMNAYTFPDHINISDAAKDIISRILIGDPTSRPTLDDLLKHDFLTTNTIPKSLPPSFLACPPSSQYIKQFMPSGFNYSSAAPQRLESTAPANIVNKAILGSTGPQSNTNRVSTQQTTAQQQMMFTDRVFKRQGTAQQAQPNFSDRLQQPPSSGTITSLASSNNPQANQQFFPITNLNGLQKERLMSPVQQKEAEIKGPSIWVKKWVDYSSKYGLGYLLSNLATGVFFNDSTKIVIDPNGKVFYYYERKPVSATEKQDVMATHSLTDYPKELSKKVTLLQHFRSYLENGNQQNKEDVDMLTDAGSASTSLNQGGSLVYVKKWMRTKHAIMFRLSNKIVQVSFQDHTEILLNSESRLVTYVNKKNERQTMPLNLALESNNAEMTKRLKYTKDILTHMLNNNNNRGANPLTAGSQNQVVQSAAVGKRSEMMGDIGGINSITSAAGPHRRPLNVLNNN